MRQITGCTALLLANILTCLILVWLRRNSGTPVEGSTTLALANLFLGLLTFFWIKSCWINSRSAKITIKYFVLWSAGYVASYFVFLRYPTYVTLVQLIIARTVAPSLVVYLTGDWRIEGKSLLQSTGSLSPLLILLFISVRIFSNQAENSSITWGHLLAAVVVFCGTFFSQFAARQISKDHATPRKSLLATFPFCLGNGILMLALIFSETSDVSTFVQADILLKSAGAAISIGLTLGLFIYGLAITPPILASLWISSLVPISMGIETIFAPEQKLDFLIGILGMMYLAFVAVMTVSQHRATAQAVTSTLPS